MSAADDDEKLAPVIDHIHQAIGGLDLNLDDRINALSETMRQLIEAAIVPEQRAKIARDVGEHIARTFEAH